MASAKRDQLIDTALRIFYRDGFHATGVDRIVEESGVARMTLYKHFRSKDELILAALRRRDERFRNWFGRAVERRAATPRDRLLAIYDALDEWFSDRDFCGCMFINASAEFSSSDEPVHRTAAEHKDLMLRYVRQLAEAAGAADPEELAHGLMLLMEGAIVMRHVAGDREAAARAKTAAKRLVSTCEPVTPGEGEADRREAQPPSPVDGA